MRKIALFAIVLMTCGTFACEGKIGRPGESQTIQGCVQSANGNYALTDDSGHVYQLTGSTGELDKHVGEQVLIRGEQVQSNQTPVAPADANSKGVPTRIVVTSSTFTSLKCTK